MSQTYRYHYVAGFETGPSLVGLGKQHAGTRLRSTLGFTGGIFVQYNTGQHLSFKSSLSFERKGATTKAQGIDGQGNPVSEVKTRFNFNYLTIPLLVKASFGKRVTWFANAGPYTGFLMNQVNVVSIDGLPTTHTDNSSQYKPLDLGISAGAGISVPARRLFDVSFEIRYNKGFINISKSGSVTTRAVHFLFGLAYKL
nr:porin family protein [Foetidibacter luteolus]